jgi:hypothetical protein
MNEELFDVEDFRDVQDELEEILAKLSYDESPQEAFMMLHAELLKIFNILVTYVDFSIQEKVLNYAREIFDSAENLLSLDIKSFSQTQKETIIEAYEQFIDNIILFVENVFIGYNFDSVSEYENKINEDKERIEFAVDF